MILPADDVDVLFSSSRETFPFSNEASSLSLYGDLEVLSIATDFETSVLPTSDWEFCDVFFWSDEQRLRSLLSLVYQLSVHQPSCILSTRDFWI